MKFDKAFPYLEEGRLLVRESWEGNGKFIFLVPGSQFKVNRPPLLGIFREGREINYRPHIDQRLSDGTIVVWSIPQEDILADDWEVLEL